MMSVEEPRLRQVCSHNELRSLLAFAGWLRSNRLTSLGKSSDSEQRPQKCHSWVAGGSGCPAVSRGLAVLRSRPWGLPWVLRAKRVGSGPALRPQLAVLRSCP